MSNLKLAKLPDRKPVKITITVSAELSASLQAYAATYREAYGDEEEVSELIPYMVEQFLAADRAFAKSQKASPVPRANGAREARDK
ncbi:MAG: DUF2274 domain-containing protein [Rhizomicrobium sp.]